MFWVKKIILGKNFLWVKNCFWSKIFGPEIFLIKQFFWPKTFFCQFFFAKKFFFGKTFFWKKYVLQCFVNKFLWAQSKLFWVWPGPFRAPTWPFWAPIWPVFAPTRLFWVNFFFQKFFLGQNFFFWKKCFAMFCQ